MTLIPLVLPQPNLYAVASGSNVTRYID